MNRSDFAFDLPADRIAQEPVTPRDQSRLLVVSRVDGTIQHKTFFELEHVLRKGDVLVLNATRVFPARLRGRKASGGKVEVLLMEGEGVQWRALIRGVSKPTTLNFPDGLTAFVEPRAGTGEWQVQFSRNSLRSYLDQHGEMPLPPYIKPVIERDDQGRYQTVFAREEGAIAAPTAGFHFTRELLDRLKGNGVECLEIVLHVGWGTFRPVRSDPVESHPMLPERYMVSKETARRLSQARTDGRRIISVGTTCTRTLETVVDSNGQFHAGSGETSLFIYPGYSFKAVDALLTNFHLPDSTPLLLACAFYGGVKNAQPFSLRSVYEEAIRERYRFYSYGDAMLIL